MIDISADLETGYGAVDLVDRVQLLLAHGFGNVFYKYCHFLSVDFFFRSLFVQILVETKRSAFLTFKLEVAELFAQV